MTTTAASTEEKITQAAVEKEKEAVGLEVLTARLAAGPAVLALCLLTCRSAGVTDPLSPVSCCRARTCDATILFYTKKYPHIFVPLPR